MKIIIFTLLILSSLYCRSQNSGDSKIMVTMPDTANLYIKTKIAIANSNFIVKDNYNMDTLTTHLKQLDFIKGHMVIYAIISGNTVTLSGIYGLNRISVWGYTRLPGNYSNVHYYKGSKTWRVLRDVAMIH